ncbi:MAG: hypothetical protein COT24_02940 [Candidatus Kerfeldbacteria bacterium CG08_land_8_20_14_0_20_40_16]|uniref:Right handed beta helix domain-containing protein n=1 Tax=Candidatus Kerfeldbacteria bacterium CG08_land_8_20_14_0_20_40_16 TaxID=2014244 RepID=A0A2H0YVV9_9BACT|nr:MAG: hypothetical protein COT24_02940 [Candidatus Kerfeldbacteria bacterium CG08_land_8_20_14_0_20_40_16]
MKRLYCWLGIIALLISAQTWAQQNISGSLSGTLGPGTYLVDGDCQVSAGQSLIIVPGTTFLHTGHFTWNIYGSLHAVGTSSSPIVFTHQSPNMLNKWAGIRFQQGASSSSVLIWCQFLWSQNGGSPYSEGGAIYSDHVAITIRNCIIDYCHASDGGGIYLDDADNSIIDSCTITNCFANSGGGIQINGSNVYIANCAIGNNSSTST